MLIPLTRTRCVAPQIRTSFRPSTTPCESSGYGKRLVVHHWSACPRNTFQTLKIFGRCSQSDIFCPGPCMGVGSKPRRAKTLSLCFALRLAQNESPLCILVHSALKFEFRNRLEIYIAMFCTREARYRWCSSRTFRHHCSRQKLRERACCGRSRVLFSFKQIWRCKKAWSRAGQNMHIKSGKSQ